MTLAIVPRPAFYTAAFDLDGSLKIQQIQRRNVLEKDGAPSQELEMLPIELLHLAQPTPQDVVSDLTAALGEVNAGLALTIIKQQADIDARDATIADLEVKVKRLQFIVDTFPSENPGPGSAADTGGG